MVLFGGLSGGVSSHLAGGSFGQGFSQGIITAGLNHALHMGADAWQEESLLEKAIIKAGFDPGEPARWTNDELTTNISKIFPELYESADCPEFEIKDIIGDKENVFGQANKKITGSVGNYKVESLRTIYIKKLALNSIRQVSSVAGHELNHVEDYVNGNYTIWYNKYNSTEANAHSEVKAYGWEQSMGSTYFNTIKYNYFLNMIKK